MRRSAAVALLPLPLVGKWTGSIESAQSMSFDVWYSFIRKNDTLNGSASANFNGQSMSFPLSLTRVKEQ